jgi:hypothetical protein
VVTSLSSIEHELLLHDVTKMSSGKVVDSGVLHVGKEYADTEVTVAISPAGEYDTVGNRAKTNTSADNAQTKKSES